MALFSFPLLSLSLCLFLSCCPFFRVCQFFWSPLSFFLSFTLSLFPCTALSCTNERMTDVSVVYELGPVIYFPDFCRACLGPDSPWPQKKLLRELLVRAEMAHTHIQYNVLHPYICTNWLHTIPLLPSCRCHWQMDVCWCPREWESEQYSVIESLLPLCTSLPPSHCGYNLQSLSWRVVASLLPLLGCLNILSLYVSLPGPVSCRSLLFRNRVLTEVTFASIPDVNHHFPHCVHVWMARHTFAAFAECCSLHVYPVCMVVHVHICVLYMYVYPLCWMTPQPVGLLHASSLFIVFLFVWLTCHPQKMFASPRNSRLDTLVRS